MAPAVLASSLAAVVDLADNPPVHIRQSATQLVQQPLTLYIARVPGSKDVFLTTIKPQEKVVTASDVQSSLYYVHVDSAEDYKLLESQDSEEGKHADDARVYRPLSEQTSVRRKPLPQGPTLALGNRPEPQAKSYAPFQAHNNNSVIDNAQVGRKPVGPGKNFAKASLEQPSPLPTRKVLGPRIMNQRTNNSEHPALQNVPARQNVDLKRWSQPPTVTPPRLPPRPSSQIGNGIHDMRLMENKALKAQPNTTNDGYSTEHCWEWEKKWRDERMSEVFDDQNSPSYIDSGMSESFDNRSLSLIRRYNGQQWNVGKVGNTSTWTTIEDIAESGPSMAIEILTPGYAKFTTPRSSGTETQTNSETLHGSSTMKGERSDNSGASNEDKAAFQRHLRLSGHARRPGHRRRFESTDSILNQEARLSFISGSGNQHSDNPSSPAVGLSVQETSSSKRFVLQSPWDGTCEFTAGIAGRSLKCKHSYRSPDPIFGPGMHSTTVSELRFNLPSSKALGSPATKFSMPGTPREVKRSSIFSNHHKKYSSSSLHTPEPVSVSAANGYFGSKVELEDRLDLTLGQEHAGGGFGGKQAKLGKLVIENEGLLMLDLIVAANMALWWRVYEKVM